MTVGGTGMIGALVGADPHQAPTARRLPDLADPRVQTPSEPSAAWAAMRGARWAPPRDRAWGKVGKGLAAGAPRGPAATSPGEDFEERRRHR